MLNPRNTYQVGKPLPQPQDNNTMDKELSRHKARQADGLFRSLSLQQVVNINLLY